MKRALPPILLFLIVGVSFLPRSWSLELPAEPFANLRAEEYRKRQAAQTELLAWAREQREFATGELFRQSRESSDPEVRERCMELLRELVTDEYLKDGKGYVGIRMQDEIANVPGDTKVRAVIRVTLVMEDSAAEKAGLQQNDLIVGLGDQVWHQGPASMSFGEKIQQMKPDTKAKLKVLRNGNLMDVEITLGRRPLYADIPFFDGRPENMEAAEQEAKELYFRKWLEQKKVRK